MPPPRVRIPDVFIPIEPRSLVLTVGQTLVVRSDGLTAWSALADESVLPATPRAGVFAHQWRFRAVAPHIPGPSPAVEQQPAKGSSS
jgi:hypothetical protein